MSLYDLKTNHLIEPVVDETPYFSWKIQSEKTGVLQESYCLRVYLKDDLVWDSGEVVSREQSFVVYEGPVLVSRGEYLWTVTVTDNHGERHEASTTFSTAFMVESDWVAQWAECPFTREPANEYKFGNAYPPVLFEREVITKKPVQKAKIYATAIGAYRLSVNGERADNREFAPEFTSYEKTLYYQTYDVTSLLKSGANKIALYVGDGWYFSTQAGPVMEHKHKEPAVLFQMELTYADGSTEVIGSDEQVTCRQDYIVYSDLYQGEKQDFTLGEFDKKPVAIKSYGYANLKAQPTSKISAIKTIVAKEILVTPNGETVVDFGQNIAGRARIHVDIPAGEQAVFEYFEELSEDGNYINTMFAPQKDTVVSGGEPIEHEALFTFHGFRYIRVSGETIKRNAKPEDFVGILLSTEKENLGSFECSDERLNKLYRNIRYSQYNNMMSVPSDCPTREKAGWTGDILVYAKTALLNEDMTPFLSGWLGSVRDDQNEDGVIKIVAPYMKLYDGLLRAQTKSFGDDKITGVAGWSDAIVWVPYDMYQVTGNKKILRDNYPAMLKWADYIIQTAKEKRGYKGIPEEYDQYLWNTGFHFGEWLVPSRPTREGESNFDVCPETSYYIAPFFGYMTLVKMTEICAVLGDKAKSKFYHETALKMKEAIQKGIFYAGLMPEQYMGAYILAFAFDLVPEDLQKPFAEKLVDLVEKNGGALDTGFLATPYILDVLCQIGRIDLAYRVLYNEKRPSWLYEVQNGATTIWESWDADDAKKGGRFVSYDHYAFGCVDTFLCEHVAGIRGENGFHHAIIAPDTTCGLLWVKRRLGTESGTIEVEWNEKSLVVTIPPNMTAEVCWNGTKTTIGSGTSRFY